MGQFFKYLVAAGFLTTLYFLIQTALSGMKLAVDRANGARQYLHKQHRKGLYIAVAASICVTEGMVQLFPNAHSNRGGLFIVHLVYAGLFLLMLLGLGFKFLSPRRLGMGHYFFGFLCLLLFLCTLFLGRILWQRYTPGKHHSKSTTAKALVDLPF